MNPALDETGRNALVGQQDSNVYFLCQTFEDSGQKTIRKISLSERRSIFMPIINWISNSHEHGKCERDLIELATRKINAVGNLEVKINGINIRGLERYRFQSNLFSLHLPKDNILDLPVGEAFFVSDGYWLFIEPTFYNLSISTFGSCSSGITKIGVTYFINYKSNSDKYND